MGKKGKARQDKFYHLAKETGYRSRAAFKLTQLNRNFEFLQKSRVVIDLCAAPGSWMQVARQNMPVSSLIIGIDLFPIKPIQGCISLTEDITTEKCRQALKGELKGWKADTVLHDGAPNVGQNWIYDSFIQNQLVLSALKLATEFLTKGGWFVTKIFRSKDYQSLIWVLDQLFKKVLPFKPHASRMESAEIFVVCKGFRAPDKLDPKFLDPKYVFQEIDTEASTVKGLVTNERNKPKAGGYEDGVTMLHNEVLVSHFVSQENFVELLGKASEISFDDETIANHPLTTAEIKECCKDIKVLGRKDMKALLTWRKNIKKDLEAKIEKPEPEEADDEENVKPDEEGDDDEDELAKIDKQVAEIEEEKRMELRRKKKKVLKERKSLQEKMRLKMVIPGDTGPGLLENSLFGLTQIKTAEDLETVADIEAGDDEEDLVPMEREPRKKKEKYNKESGRLDSSGKFYRGEQDSEEELNLGSDDEYESDVPETSLGIDVSDESDSDSDAEVKQPKKVRFADPAKEELAKKVAEKKQAAKKVLTDDLEHPLLTDLQDGDSKQKRKRKADQWFNKSIFENLEDEDDEDLELENMASKFPRLKKPNLDDNLNDSDDDSDVDSDDMEATPNGKHVPVAASPTYASSDESNSEIASDSDNSDTDNDDDSDKEAPEDQPAPGGKVRGKKRSLTAEALALGSMMIHSAKAKRDILDEGWNRFAFNDEHLPDWFVEDERRHSHKDLPITKELVQEYRDRMKEINVRPIKKVVEAKARKKRRATSRMERAKKKADMISENMGMSDYDKAQQIRQLHKKATQEKKKEVTYVVAKRSQAGKRAVRPAGVKGAYKQVDKRMKKDDKRRKATERRKGGRKKNK